MALRRAPAAVHHIRRLVASQSVDGLSDRQLLERYLSRHDDTAFTALVQRYGPLVLRVCRRVLGDWHACEDAVQATFLVLARKATAIRKQQSVSSWLHGVAYRVSLKARGRGCRSDRLPAAAERLPADPVADVTWRELRDVLDEELRLLPDKYAAPLLLCYLESKTRDEAAHQLGWPLGTFNKRLDRGRELLRARLTRRGLGLAAVLSAAQLSAVVAAAAPPAILDGTARAVLELLANESVDASAPAVLLAEGVIHAMTAKWKLTMLLVLVLGILGTGSGLWLHQPAAAQSPAALDARAEPKAVARPAATDLHDDPLPAGALARIGTVRWRHGRPITFVGFGPEGKTIVSASEDGTIRQWDRQTGKETRRFGKLNNAAGTTGVADDDFDIVFSGSTSQKSAAISADGKLLAFAGDDGIVHIWDLAAGKELHQIKWDPAAGKELPQIKGTADVTPTLAFSTDGKLLAVHSLRFLPRNDALKLEQKVVLYTVATAKEQRTLSWKGDDNGALFNSGPGAVVFSPDGRFLATAILELDNMTPVPFVLSWDLQAREEKPRKVKGEGFGAPTMAFTADSKALAFTQEDRIRLVDPATGKEIRNFKNPEGGSAAIVFAPDGKRIAIKGSTQLVSICDAATGKIERQIGERMGGFRSSALASFGIGRAPDVAFAHDSKQIAIGGDMNTVRLWDVESGKEVGQVGGHGGPVTSLALTPDGKVLYSQSGDGTLRRWNAATGKELARIALPASVNRVAISPDGKTAAFAGRDKAIRLHDLVADKELRTLDGHNDGSALVVFSADGTLLASRTRAESSIKIFNVATGKELRTIAVPVEEKPQGDILLELVSGSRNNSLGLVFSPDGRLLASNGPKGTLCLFDTATGKEARRIAMPRQGVNSFAFSPDSRMLATENSDTTLSLWEVATGEERLKLGEAPQRPAGNRFMMGTFFRSGVPTTSGAVPGVAYSPDGRLIAIRGPVGQVRVWDVLAGKELEQLKGHQGPLTALAFAAEGTRLASASQDTTALVWDMVRLSKDLKKPAAALDDKQVQAIWDDLKGTDARKADRGIKALAAAPEQTVPFLRKHLKPIEAVDAERVEQLIADLESKDFTVRQAATDELEKIGELAMPALKKVLDGQPGLEVRQRIDKLLEKAAGHKQTPERLQALRAVEALELMDTAEARTVLETMATGAAGTRVTEEARSAVKRLGADAR